MKSFRVFFSALAVTLCLGAVLALAGQAQAADPDPAVKLETSMGDIIVRLDSRKAPISTANFVQYVKSGFYDGTVFHRVIKNFMAQGGCPSGRGTGGPGWSIACECRGQKSRHKRGSLSMAHAGPNTGGSQFFICFVDCPHLDSVHTVFGAIDKDDKESFKVLDSITQNDKMITIEIKDKL